MGGVFCVATHYWEQAAPSLHAGDPSVGEHLRRLIDRAVSEPRVVWRSVGEVVSESPWWCNMCGFIAILQNAPIIDIAAARRALDSIAHRGPDAAGEWRERDVFLGHRRLSIIDLATGDQPMQSSDGRYVIVFNGEIYNFVELRDVLTAEGATFRTRSDTEVILEGYRRWGSGVVKRLHGMFAFVIWDRVRLSAFAARDRLGIKPLCWAMHRGALVVSSTLEPFSCIGCSLAKLT